MLIRATADEQIRALRTKSDADLSGAGAGASAGHIRPASVPQRRVAVGAIDLGGSPEMGLRV